MSGTCLRGVQTTGDDSRGHRKPPRGDLGTRGRRREDRGRDQGRRRASAHEAPALGDLGDELVCTIAGSVLVAECSDFAGHCLLVKGHDFEA